MSFVNQLGIGFFQAGKNKAAARLPEQEEDVLEKKRSGQNAWIKRAGFNGNYC